MNVVIGDATQPLAAVLVISDGANPPFDVQPGAMVPLEAPPQGGEVIYVSARVRNVESCNVSFAARLSDPMSGDELGFDKRDADLELGSDGWGHAKMPLTSYFANVSPCPDNQSFAIVGHPSTLSVTVTDARGQTTTVSQPVVPACTQPDAEAQAHCQCLCSPPSGCT